MENEYSVFAPFKYVTMECSGQRKQLIFEYVDEYQLWCCWIREEKHFNGDGDSPAEAFEDMIYRMPEMIERMKRIDEARREARNLIA